jgi:bacterioferritin-associated ferredoxin
LIFIINSRSLRVVIVCSCHAVTDREVRHAARAGARTTCQIAEMCGAGSGCGGCRETLHELLEETHAEACMTAARARPSSSESASA